MSQAIFASKNSDRIVATLTDSQAEELGEDFLYAEEQGDVWSVYVSKTGKIFWTSNSGLKVHKTKIYAIADFGIYND